MPCHGHGEKPVSRRQALKQFANGFGVLGLANLLAQDVVADSINASAANPLAVRAPMYAPRAKSVIFLFMAGGPSHVDLFDPKPRLVQEDGKPLPFPMPALMRTKTGNLLGSKYKFSKHGQSGTEVSELLPHIGSCVDDICVVRSMVADNINHNGACLQMNTGEQTFSRPSLGSWLLYGLGSENQNLPGFVVLSPAQPAQGAPLWSSSFLQAAYQGTLVSDLKKPIADLSNARLSSAQQRRQLDMLKQLNRMHQASREEDSRLSARIASFELAFRMQAETPKRSTSLENHPPRGSSTAWTIRRRRFSPASVCWPAGWSNAACAWCRSTIRKPAIARAASFGTSTEVCTSSCRTTALRRINLWRRC